MNLSKTFGTLCCTLTILIQISGCSVGYKNTPDLTRLKELSFRIDGEKFSLYIPEGGQERRYVLDDITSVDEKDRDLHLMTVGYDLQVSSNKYYNMTHVLFGLTKDGCCTVSEAMNYTASRRKNNSESQQREVNGKQTLYVESDQEGDNLFVEYYVPFNDSYNFFYILWVDEDVKKDIDFVSVRIEMLDNIVKSSGFLEAN